MTGVIETSRNSGEAAGLLYMVNGRSVLVGASVGYANWPEGASDAGGLMRYADGAVYQAKRNGGDRRCSDQRPAPSGAGI